MSKLQRMHRKRGRRQVQGLTWPLRERMLNACGHRLIDARNRALLAVAYDTLLRRSELVALQVSDLLVEVDGSGTLRVQRSKTDPNGEGAVLYLAPDTIQLVQGVAGAKWSGPGAPVPVHPKEWTAWSASR